MQTSSAAPPRAPTTRWWVVAALLFTIVMNAVAVLLPLAGRTTGEISDRFPVLITPAGYTFSIWSVIYVALAAFVVYQAFAAQEREPLFVRVRGLFIASCLLNVGWLVSWHYLLVPLSLIVMLALLATLVVLYVRSRGSGPSADASERLFVRLPFSLYLGWITVATAVNVRVWTYWAGWTGGGPLEVAVTVAALVAIVALSLWLLARRNDVAYAAVVAWAFLGIYMANAGEPVVGLGALTASVLVAAAAAWRAVAARRELLA